MKCNSVERTKLVLFFVLFLAFNAMHMVVNEMKFGTCNSSLALNTKPP